MRVAGIIAEYNPLHNGHLHHIEQTRSLTGSDYVIVVMSGDFVQRGEPAVADKFIRAEWALAAGADLVLELPTVCALASAERFAYGGVRVLAGTGVVNTLCFGSENPNVEVLKAGAGYLGRETPAFKHALMEQLSIGKSYPRARYDALEAIGAPKELLGLLRAPNSILGMEYIRFLNKYAPEIEPLAIARVGNAHDEEALTGEFSSASAIREALARQDAGVQSSMPLYVAGRFALGARPVTVEDAAQLMLYALRRMEAADCRQLPDVQEGFENVLHRAAQSANSLEELLARIKSKRYTMARCKRIALSAMLGITKQLAEAALEEDALYLRVLGFRREARRLLSAISRQGALPLVTRFADMEPCSANARALLELDRRAHGIYALIAAPESPTPDYSHPPVIV